MLAVALNEGEQRNVIARLGALEMRGEMPGERRLLAECLDMVLVGVKADDVRLEERLLLWQRAALLVGRGQLACLLLACFDIGLVEWIDADDRAGDSRRDLETEELLANCIVVGDVDANDGMPHRFDGIHGVVLRVVRFGREAQIDKHAVTAVCRGVAERFEIDRHNTFAVLAG